MSVPIESFFLPLEREGTLQQRVKRQVVEGILSGRFAHGARLPSTRALARHLGVSRITIAFAYTDLVADDYLVSRGRSGYYVSSAAPQTSAPQTQPHHEGDLDWSRLIRRSPPHPTRIDRPTDWQRYPYPFLYGQPDPALFEHANWRQCALQALGQREFDALTADHYERDDPELVDYLLRHILPRRGIAAGPENVLLTLGSQNALWLTAQLLLSPRRTAVLENPGYTGLRDILEHTGCRVATVDVDAEGLAPIAIPEEAHVVFVTASHHCPTGVAMPMARRKALLDRATELGCVLVEDDYEFELAMPGAAAPALKAMDRSGCVVYAGSFSKTLFPGLRLGYLVAPEPFVRHARALRGTVLRHPPGVVQRTVARFLALGHYDTQIKRMRAAYQARKAELHEALSSYGLAPASATPTAGTSVWMRAPPGVDTGTLANALRAQGVVIEAGAPFFSPDTPDTAHYRLAISSIPEARIRSGVGLIAEEISAMSGA
ncbi:MAG: PLP-dependent aminotransferase family protein [Pseudomonadota bacterium]